MRIIFAKQKHIEILRKITCNSRTCKILLIFPNKKTMHNIQPNLAKKQQNNHMLSYRV